MEMPPQTITRIWTKIVCKLISSLDNIKGDTQEAKLKRFDFHAIWDKCIYFIGGFLTRWSGYLFKNGYNYLYTNIVYFS